ncbi:MAG: hypothetical protein Fur007_02220 [Rhodoferax sp.]
MTPASTARIGHRPLQGLLGYLAQARERKLAQWQALGPWDAGVASASESRDRSTKAQAPAAPALATQPAPDVVPPFGAAAAYFRATWGQLDTARRLRVAQQRLPANAGPYNAHRLLVQALLQLHQHSPVVAQAWVAWLDTLWALPAPEAPPAARGRSKPRALAPAVLATPVAASPKMPRRATRRGGAQAGGAARGPQ